MSWDKIYLLEGCPYYIDWFADDLIQELGNPNTIRLDNNVSASEFTSALTAFSFYDVPDLILVKNPDAELFNTALDQINNLKCSALVFIVEDNTFDGRQSFVSKANKNRRVKTFEHLEQGSNLKSFFGQWEKRIEFSKDCLDWLNKNAPTKLAKTKINGQKKEIIVIDLPKIENEFNKIYSIYLNDKIKITPNILESFCSFHKESEIWNFLDAVLLGDLPSIISYFENNKLTTNNEGPLWVISSQLELYLQLANSASQESLTLNNKINYYLSDNFEPIENTKPKPQINPYRMKLALETCKKVKVSSIVHKYIATINAIRDLRAGLSADLVSGLLSLAYSERNKYLEPVYDV